jgi:2-polyprenyl-3-methyl-5-hydroxy-6-metoxy-1,4-benzoquinol methylase
MQKEGHKYQREYEDHAGCFWGVAPGKYVTQLCELFNNDLRNTSILDLGAGEGKNSVYCANLGANVVAIDASPIAISRFVMQPNYECCQKNISTYVADINSSIFDEDQFDIIIAYGILHCLPSKKSIFEMITKIKTWTKQNGFAVCATFTNVLPPPSIQDYLEEKSFLSTGELQVQFKDWKLISEEDGLIEEIHPTTNILHKHSISRIIAQKV